DLSAPAVNSAVTRNPITAYGFVTGGTGQPGVRWTNDRGYSGTATVTATNDGRYRWEVTPLALLPGTNNFTVTALDVAGAMSSKSFAVSYSVPDNTDPSGDNHPPQLSITAPNSPFIMTPS